MSEKIKTLEEKWEEEVLSDNTGVIHCKQCEGCEFQSDGTVWSNSFQKGNCAMYPYPESKPIGVINNTGFCPYRE